MKRGLYFATDGDWTMKIVIHRIMKKTAEVSFHDENGTYKKSSVSYLYPLSDLQNIIEIEGYEFMNVKQNLEK